MKIQIREMWFQYLLCGSETVITFSIENSMVHSFLLQFERTRISAISPERKVVLSVRGNGHSQAKMLLLAMSLLL
jgi:hypothetical protein